MDRITLAELFRHDYLSPALDWLQKSEFWAGDEVVVRRSVYVCVQAGGFTDAIFVKECDKAVPMSHDISSADPSTAKCPHCGLSHDTTCPRIRAIEYYPDGTTKRVEFHGAAPIAAPSPGDMTVTCGFAGYSPDGLQTYVGGYMPDAEEFKRRHGQRPQVRTSLVRLPSRQKIEARQETADMFTLKVLRDHPMGGQTKIVEAESFTINKCYGGAIVEITAHRPLGQEDIRFDIGQLVSIPSDSLGAHNELWDRAIIENSAGKTSEIFHPLPRHPERSRYEEEVSVHVHKGPPEIMDPRGRGSAN
jgi:hypothetical protein